MSSPFTLALPASLTLREAGPTLRQFGAEIQGCSATGVRLDAGALQQLDSATLAVLLDCRRQAQGRQLRFEVVNAPERLVALARLYGVLELLGLADQSAAA